MLREATTEEMGLVSNLDHFFRSMASVLAGWALLLGALIEALRRMKELREFMKEFMDFVKQWLPPKRQEKTRSRVARKPLTKRYLGSFRLMIFLLVFSLLIFGGHVYFVAHAQGINTGKLAPAAESFSVDKNYVPSGKMGDVGDVEIGFGSGGSRQFTYIPMGREPHEYRWKYRDNQLTKEPAKFAGVIYLNPADDFGSSPSCGWDLRGFHRVTWEARSAGKDDIDVDFFVGGIDWVWQQKDGKWTTVSPPYPDSMPRAGLGSKNLTHEWQTFHESVDQPAESFKRVVGGFGWSMSWGSRHSENHDDKSPLILELRNIRYEK